MKTAISSLQEKRDAFDKLKKNYEDTVVHIEVCAGDDFGNTSKFFFKSLSLRLLLQAQARFVERRTHEEFERFRTFLNEQEEARMEALRREEEQKTEEMRKMVEEMERNILSVSESIRLLEEGMASEGISVLHVSLLLFEL